MAFTNSDITVGTLQSGSTPTHRLQHNGLNAAVRELLSLTFDAREYGALPNSGSDEMAHIQAAIDAAAAAGGGIVRLIGGTYLITGSLNINDDGVILEGAGRKQTILKRSGSSNGAVVKLQTVDGNTDKIEGCGVRRLSIDGIGNANYGIRITTVNFADVSQLEIKGGAAAQIYMDCWTTTTGDPRDNQQCALRDLYLICTGSQHGLFLTGNAAPDANTSLNRFDNIFAKIENGDGFHFANCDNNISTALRVHRVGTGNGLWLGGSASLNQGHARHNQFFGVEFAAGSGVIAKANTQNSGPNFIWGYSLGNSAPAPTIESGAVLKYVCDDGTGNWP